MKSSDRGILYVTYEAIESLLKLPDTVTIESAFIDTAEFERRVIALCLRGEGLPSGLAVHPGQPLVKIDIEYDSEGNFIAFRV